MKNAPLAQLLDAQSRWDRLISRPDWYLTLIPETEILLQAGDELPERERTALKSALYDYFEGRLTRRSFTLGDGRLDADSERLQIDTIVVHHTSNPPGLSPARLSAIELIRLYGPYFTNPPDAKRGLRGGPLFSGHERNGTQVFWPYHWLIRTDGRADHLLDDDEIGWHAGDWNTNCRSVAIAFDDDLEFKRPTPQALTAVAALIKRSYPNVSRSRMIGHMEVRGRTTCPSTLFLENADGPGWKHDLSKMISKSRGRS